MPENIDKLISGKEDMEEADIDGIDVPVTVLKDLKAAGYAHLKANKENNTLSLWGNRCAACFFKEQLFERM